MYVHSLCESFVHKNVIFPITEKFLIIKYKISYNKTISAPSGHGRFL